MIRIPFLAIVTILLQQYIQIAQGDICANNPCGLVAGIYEPATGYCCIDSASYHICICPGNIQTINAPCRTGAVVVPNQVACSKTCVNGGVCNIVNNQQVCWCQLGYSGDSCELQGIQTRCVTGLCQFGTCYEQTIGASTYAYCQCTPGYYGTTCNQCYFTCQAAGVFPDTAQCAIGRYFYCQQANTIPIAASCPTGQKFNRFTNQCDSTYQCT